MLLNRFGSVSTTGAVHTEPVWRHDWSLRSRSKGAFNGLSTSPQGHRQRVLSATATFGNGTAGRFRTGELDIFNPDTWPAATFQVREEPFVYELSVFLNVFPYRAPGPPPEVKVVRVPGNHLHLRRWGELGALGLVIL